MKLGFPKARMRNVAGATMGADLAAREWAGQRAVYESSQQMFSSVADTLSKREKRKSMLQYQDTVSQASRLLDSGDELTLADIEDIIDPSLLDEETRNYALANEGRVPTWKVQGQLLSAVMEQAAEKATQGISIPAERDAFNDQLREQNIRVLEASMADAANKKGVWEQKDALAMYEKITDWRVGLNALRTEEVLDEQQIAKLQRFYTHEGLKSEVNEIIETGTPEDMLKAADFYMSEDGANIFPLQGEDDRRIQATRLRTAANAALSTGSLSEEAKYDFRRANFRATEAVDNLNLASSRGINIAEEVEILKADIGGMSKSIKGYKGDTSVLATAEEDLRQRTSDLKVLETIQNVRNVPASSITTEYLISAGLSETEASKVMASVGERKNNLSTEQARNLGLMSDDTPFFTDDSARNELAAWAGVDPLAIPSIPQNLWQSASLRYEANVMETDELLAFVAATDAPGAASQITTLEGSFAKTLVTLSSVPVNLRGSVASGIKTWDTLNADAVKDIKTELTGEAEGFYIGRQSLLTSHATAIGALEASETMTREEATRAVVPKVIERRGGLLVLPANEDPDKVMKYLKSWDGDGQRVTNMGWKTDRPDLVAESIAEGMVMFDERSSRFYLVNELGQKRKDSDGSFMYIDYDKAERSTARNLNGWRKELANFMYYYGF